MLREPPTALPHTFAENAGGHGTLLGVLCEHALLPAPQAALGWELATAVVGTGARNWDSKRETTLRMGSNNLNATLNTG